MPRVDRTAGTHERGPSRERNPAQAAAVAGSKRPAGRAAVTRSELRVAKWEELVPGKAAIVPRAPVPETDTGGRGENPKAGGRSIAKELGKMAP